jgi:glycosyltransferase involved in cell wall biosynthesis
MKPMVSVCMIAYNMELYIREAILGVLMQEADFEFELVISDDNSTDNTQEIIKDLIKNHPQGHLIKYYKQKKNLGMLKNYLFAFEKCYGKYLSICDSDDYWTDHKKLAKQVEFLESNKDYVLSFHDSKKIDSKGREIQNSIEDYIKRDLCFEDLSKAVYPIPTASVLFRNDIGLEFPEVYRNGTNHDSFLFILISQFGKLHFQRNVGPSAYRIHSKGTWSSRSKLGKSLHSLDTFSNVCLVFPRVQGFKDMVFEFRNHVIVYALKEREYIIFIKSYFKNLLYSFSNSKYLSEYFSLHLKLFKKK